MGGYERSVGTVITRCSPIKLPIPSKKKEVSTLSIFLNKKIRLTADAKTNPYSSTRKDTMNCRLAEFT